MKIPNCILKLRIGSITNMIVIESGADLLNPTEYRDELFTNTLLSAQELNEAELLKIGLEYLLTNFNGNLEEYADRSMYEWDEPGEVEGVIREMLKRMWPNASPTPASVLAEVELTYETMPEWRDMQRQKDWEYLVEVSVNPDTPATIISDEQLIDRFQTNVAERPTLYALMARRATRNEQIKTLLFENIGYLNANRDRYLVTLLNTHVPILFILEEGDVNLKMRLKEWMGNNWNKSDQERLMYYMEKDEDKYPIVKEMLS